MPCSNIKIVLFAPSVPCEPSRIQAVMDCNTQVALVEWYPSDGALTYALTATTASGHNVTCENGTAHCELEGLLCGHSYSVSVRAVGQTCSSVAHMTGHLVTGNAITSLTLHSFTFNLLCVKRPSSGHSW